MPADNTYKGHQVQEDIRRYLSGEMTASEMHALEKAALDDPFLADAIEGMSARNPELLKSDTDELRRRLEEKSNPQIRLPRVVMWRRIGIAAAVLALAIISTLLLVNRVPDSEVIAEAATKPENLPKVSASEKQPDSVRENSTPVPTATDSQLLTRVDKNETTAARTTVIAAKKVSESVALSKKEDKVIIENETSSALAETVTVQPAPVLMKPASQESRTINGYLNVDDISKNKSAGNSNLYFYSGQVTDVNLQPISFANISIKNSNHLTYTDAKGNFRLLSADSSLNVDIKSVGFSSNSSVLSYRQPQHQLVLNPLPAKQKKKFSVKSNSNDETKLNEADSLLIADDSAFVSTEPEAEPVDGWGLYHLYVLNNVRPQKNPDNKISDGTVVVSFLVNPNGWLTEFKIEKSLNSSCDREAIRLIREGPKWELYNTEKALRTKVTVSF